MKILFIVDKLEVGGTERSAVTLCNYWVNKGYDIYLIVIFSGKGKNDYFLEKSERYSHSTDYIEKLCIKYDYKILYSRDLNLRKENNKTTKASLYLLEF